MVYIQRSDGALAVFEGMSFDQVQAMLHDQGLTCTEITKEQYDALRPQGGLP